MNAIEQLATRHPGFGAAPFRRAAQPPSSTVTTPLPPLPSGRPPSVTEPNPPVMSASQTLRQMQIEQAGPAQTSARSDYQWATLNVAAIIGGHTFPAGTRIAVAPSQTSTSGGGKAHTTSIVTKVWAKFGQTFDSSSWVEGALSANLFTYTGQSATWSSSTGFGALGDINTVAPTPREATAGGVGFFTGLVVGAAIGVVGTAVWASIMMAREEEEARYRRAGYSGR